MCYYPPSLILCYYEPGIRSSQWQQNATWKCHGIEYQGVELLTKWIWEAGWPRPRSADELPTSLAALCELPVFQKLCGQSLSFLSGRTFHIHIEGHTERGKLKAHCPSWHGWKKPDSSEEQRSRNEREMCDSRDRALGLPLHPWTVMYTCGTREC